MAHPILTSIRTKRIKLLFKYLTLGKSLKTAVTQPDFKSFCQDLGYNLTVANFYSSIPMMTDLDAHYAANDNKPLYNHESVFNKKTMEAFLNRLMKYEPEFKPPQNPTDIETEYFSKNEMFSHSDAMAYYAIIRHFKPQKIFEIGCGYSTLVANCAVTKNKSGRIIANEPYPRGFLHQLPDVKLTAQTAQKITAKHINSQLNDGDILFVDTTHTVKEGSDVIHIICDLLPNITKTTYVHFHDIFLPFVYPKGWIYEGRNWEEQYLLYAYLLNNKQSKVLYSSAYNAHYFKKAMKGFTVDNPGGGSLWLKLN